MACDISSLGTASNRLLEDDSPTHSFLGYYVHLTLILFCWHCIIQINNDITYYTDHGKYK